MASTDLLCGPSKPDIFNQEDPQPNIDKTMSEITFNEKCKSCTLIKHDPLSCEEADKIFTELSNERDIVDSFEALDMLWIIKTCSMCPHCGKFYEKKGGCDNMICNVCNKNFWFFPISQVLHYLNFTANGGSLPPPARGNVLLRRQKEWLEWLYREKYRNYLSLLYAQLKQFTKLRICVVCSVVKLLDKIETSKITHNKYVSRKRWPEKDRALNYICTNCAPKCEDCRQLVRIHWHRKCKNCYKNSIPSETVIIRPTLSPEKDTRDILSSSPKHSNPCPKRVNFECNSNYKLKKQLDEKRKHISSHRNLMEKYKSIELTRVENRAKKAATSKLKAKKKSRSIAHKYSE